MIDRLDPMDLRLLNDWQRDFPLTSRPFAEIAAQLGSTEDEVLERLKRFSGTGAISRIGATCRPNTLAASTLAAVAAPEGRIEQVAAIIGAESGVNHSYLREDAWNIWFVATGPDRTDVERTLDRIRTRTGLRVLDLPLMCAFNVDLGFSMDGSGGHMPQAAEADHSAALPGDGPLMQALSKGLDLVGRPFLRLAEDLRRSEDEVIERIAALSAAGIISRMGVIVRHRALGWTSNAMVVWSVPETKIERAGRELTAVPGVTLCYQRRAVPVVWPYTLYCMIHARSRSDAMAVLEVARRIEALADVPHKVLFSLRCFKQRGALIHRPSGVAA